MNRRTSSRNDVFILSIDGGGTSALVPVMILGALEEELRMRGSALTLPQCFDLWAGTSTGAFSALSLLVPNNTFSNPKYSSSDVINMYRNMFDYLIEPVPLAPAHCNNSTSEQILAYKVHAMRKYIAHEFGYDVLLGNTLAPVLIPVYDMGNNIPHTFDSINDSNLFVADVLWAGSASPVYYINTQMQDTYMLSNFADGMVYLPSPAVSVLQWARDNFDEHITIHVVSLGTGIYPMLSVYDDRLLHMDMTSRQQLLSIRHMINSQVIHTGNVLSHQRNIIVYHINFLLEYDGVAALQDVENQKKQMEYTEYLGRTIIHKHRPMIRELAGCLVDRKDNKRVSMVRRE